MHEPAFSTWIADRCGTTGFLIESSKPSYNQVEASHISTWLDALVRLATAIGSTPRPTRPSQSRGYQSQRLVHPRRAWLRGVLFTFGFVLLIFLVAIFLFLWRVFP